MLAFNIAIASLLAIVSAQQSPSPRIESPAAGDIWLGGETRVIEW